MEYRDEQRRLYRRLVAKGAKRSEFKNIAEQENVAAPGELIEKWEDRFFQAPMENYPVEPRLINRFCVGADPEFVFSQPRFDDLGRRVEGKYIYAEQLGLNTLEAFGSDMSGRQAELRAFPSRFVIDVVASLIEALRWMNEVHHLDKYDWYAPALHCNDGIGGHIHIGRKRPDAEVCIRSLDSVTELLLNANVLDSRGQIDRRRITAYGHWGDWRPQQHGYEYRTMPSWMTSPWAAYFTLVVSKLCVLDDARDFLGNGRPQETLANLLRAYKSRDDDARIALVALERLGFPTYMKDDFKGRWGVASAKNEYSLSRLFIPPVIEASSDTKKQLFEHLTGGGSLVKASPQATWMPVQLPSGLFKPNVQPHVYGVSDVAQGLLSRTKLDFVRGDRAGFYFGTPKRFDPEPIVELIRKQPSIDHWKFVVMPQESYVVCVPADIYDNDTHSVNKEKRNALRSILIDSGYFPLLRYTDWDKPPIDPAKPIKKTLPKPIGRVESNITGEQEPELVEFR